MKLDPDKFKKQKEPKKSLRLEDYLIAAENPVGRKQLRLIFRRKRSKEVLTREQVTAIKKGRKLLRAEMKAQGLKRRIDFETTATNLNLYFDRNRLLWPFFLWLIRDNTVAKILATTAVLTTLVTVTEPLIQYVTQYVTQYVDRIVQQYLDREVNRFTIDLSDGLTNRGFLLAETPSDFTPDANGKVKATTNLMAPPVAGIPCVSITSIPYNVHTMADGAHHDTYFAYTFYTKYVVDSQAADAKEPMDYTWHLKLKLEQSNDADADISQAGWAMVFESDVTTVEGAQTTYVDGPAQMAFYAELGADGEKEAMPERSVTDVAYADFLLKDFLKNPDQLEVMKEGSHFDYYRLLPEDFPDKTVAAEGRREGVLPNDIHKYTVVLWLEGDDPECVDALMGSAIGMNFLIKLEEEDINSEATTPVLTPDNGTDVTLPS